MVIPGVEGRKESSLEGTCFPPPSLHWDFLLAELRGQEMGLNKGGAGQGKIGAALTGAFLRCPAYTGRLFFLPPRGQPWRPLPRQGTRMAVAWVRADN